MIVNRGVFGATRLLAFISVLILLAVLLWALGPARPGPCERVELEAILTAYVAIAPFAWLLFRLRTSTPGWPAKAKTTLAWVLPLALLVTAYEALQIARWASAPSYAGFTLWKLFWPALAALHMAFLVTGFRTYRAIPIPANCWVQWVVGFTKAAAWASFALFVLAMTLPLPIRAGLRANEAAAIGALRKIGRAEADYRSQHPGKGFAGTLADLGPPPGANLIDTALANGLRSGYEFGLNPGPLDAQGRSTSFVATARPTQYGLTGCRCYFEDQSSVIRWTSQDRAATREDPPVE